MNSRALWILPLMFLLASCGPPVSVQPLGDAKAAPVDKALAGEWRRCAKGDGDMEGPLGLRFTPQEKGPWLLAPMKDDGTWNDEESLPAFTTLIGCDRYLNLCTKDDEKKEIRYVFGKYSLSLDGTFMLALMTEEPVAKAIDEKRLQGKVDRNDKGEIKSVLITDSAENIRACIEKEDPRALFQIIGTYKRPGPKTEEKF